MKTSHSWPREVYLDWSRLSGLYLDNISRADCYRKYQLLLSSAGVTTVIVGEFLENADPIVDVTAWRTHNVYEMGDEKKSRIAMTAEALEAIGAHRIAAAVRTAKSSSPFDTFRERFSTGETPSMDDVAQFMEQMKGANPMAHFQENIARNLPETAKKAGIKKPKRKTPTDAELENESKEQIEHLLEQFVAAHQKELKADLKKHGDPRTKPGFTHEGRYEEIDRMRRRMWAAESQKEAIEKLNELREKIAGIIGKPGFEKKTKTMVPQFSRKIRDIVKEHRKSPADDLIPEMVEALTATEEFMASHAEIFAPPMLGDDSAAKRMTALGAYEVDVSHGRTEVAWDSPQGFTCDGTDFSLTLDYPSKKPKLLEPLLDAVDRLKRRLPALLEESREQLIAGFRENYQPQLDDELEDYDVDEDGEVSDESILAHAKSPGITLVIEEEGDGVYGTTSFDIDWDDEHGFTIEWEDEA